MLSWFNNSMLEMCIVHKYECYFIRNFSFKWWKKVEANKSAGQGVNKSFVMRNMSAITKMASNIINLHNFYSLDVGSRVTETRLQSGSFFEIYACGFEPPKSKIIIYCEKANEKHRPHEAHVGQYIRLGKDKLVAVVPIISHVRIILFCLLSFGTQSYEFLFLYINFVYLNVVSLLIWYNLINLLSSLAIPCQKTDYPGDRSRNP